MSTNASATVLQFTDAGSQLRTLQCDLNDVSYASSREIAKTETFCATEKSPGNLDISITVAGLYSGGSDEIDEVLDGLKRDQTPRLYKYGPEGSGMGAPLYSGLSYLTQYTLGASAGGQVEVSATFEVDGDDVRSAW